MLRLFIIALPLVIGGIIFTFIDPFSINESLFKTSKYFYISLLAAIVIYIILANENFIKKYTNQGFILITSRLTRVLGIIVLAIVLAILLVSIALTLIIDEILIFSSLFILICFVPPAWIIYKNNLILYSEKEIIISNLLSTFEVQKSEIIEVSKVPLRGYRISFNYNNKHCSRLFYVKPDSVLGANSDLPTIIDDMLDE